MSLFENSERTNLQMQALIVLVCATVYFYAFKLNLVLFQHLEFADNVNWVFIPSGLRLLFVLILFESGALGIGLASVLINYMYSAADDHLFNIVTGLMSGASPMLARYFAVDLFRLDATLTGLNARVLFKISVLFALISAVLHQMWFFWNGKATNFVSGTLAMAVGDWCGTVLVLGLASYALRLYKALQR
jgi:hypothetical protein